MDPKHARRPVETQELKKLQNVTLAIVEEELGRLYEFVSTYNKIEKRKLDFYKAKQSAETGSKGARTKLDGVRTRLKPLEAKQREDATALARLKTPPQRASFEGYFAAEDISDQIRKQFPFQAARLRERLHGRRQHFVAAVCP